MGFGKPEGLMGRLLVKIMNRFHAQISDWGFRALGAVSETACVLDVGCGGGANVSQWLKKCPRGMVWGIDYANVSVKESEKVNHAAIQAGRCHIICGSVSNLPMGNASFDVVSAFETVYFWPNITADFAEVCRVLKPGGKFLVVNEITADHEGAKRWESRVEGMKVFSAEAYAQAMRDAGFRAVDVQRHTTRGWTCLIAVK